MASDAAAAATGAGAGDAGRGSLMAAEAVVQKQLEAYNARDIEAFMALMSDDCVAKDAVTGAVMAQGKQQLRERYENRFKTAVYSELLGRLCLGDVVVDREIIMGLPDGAAADCLATYHCKGGKIVRMEFVWQPRQ
jgi:putative hydrolase of HD superfamily